MVSITINTIDAACTLGKDTELGRSGAPGSRPLDSWFAVLHYLMFSSCSCPSSSFPVGWAVQTRLLVCVCVYVLARVCVSVCVCVG